MKEPLPTSTHGNFSQHRHTGRAESASCGTHRAGLRSACEPLRVGLYALQAYNAQRQLGIQSLKFGE